VHDSNTNYVLNNPTLTPYINPNRNSNNKPYNSKLWPDIRDSDFCDGAEVRGG